MLENIQSKGSSDMKEDFITVKQQLPGICRIAADFYLTPKRKGVNFFVKSPVTADKTWSLCLYPGNERFVDYANGNFSGDAIGFVSYVKNINQWQALKMLKDFYGLSGSSEQSREEMQRKIRLQQEREQKAAERKKQFKTALSGEIESLQSWAGIYGTAIEKQLFEPFSDLWAYCVGELQKVDCKLDILCCSDCKAYLRLKSNADLGLSSDRYQWLLDALAILADCGRFKATDAEIREITAQRDFELARTPGQDRRCGIEW